jgi:hypothetical protein
MSDDQEIDDEVIICKSEPNDEYDSEATDDADFQAKSEDF